MTRHSRNLDVLMHVDGMNAIEREQYRSGGTFQQRFLLAHSGLQLQSNIPNGTDHPILCDSELSRLQLGRVRRALQNREHDQQSGNHPCPIMLDVGIDAQQKRDDDANDDPCRNEDQDG
eukprot:CAMPEP_0119566066 /NCGR_PEP_ID=MMETSP1352-20130426/31994_1 /TAXON_ID=265584 /ORGANISM="Stauroneis constricta, Strain CCMP1120" /LENGTH=118 /DNA_ID=CAMNT_0007615111 /DNA_START=339 /DNA_END=695 /DNA_ORIENTATION=-